MRPGGRTAFFTIFAPNDVAPSERKRARAAAPRYGWSRADHAQLMRSAGFVGVEELDCTREYAATLQAWHDVSAEHADELAALTSLDAFEDRQRERRAALAAVADGLQRRVLLVGTAPMRAAR